jgi:peptidoglycan-N-acetylglucosamine deacetylase
MPGNLRAASGRDDPNLGRRRMLVVAAGGVLVGIGTVVGRGGGPPASVAADRTETADRAGHTKTAVGTEQAGRTQPGTTGPPAAAASPSATREHTAEPSAGKRKVSVTDAPAAREPQYYVDDGPKVIALTIDDGPSPLYTPQVLRVLEKYGVTATFSMVGENVTYHPAIAKEVADAGHTIINHTWDHANLTLLSASAQRTEIARTTEAIHTATGVRPRMFRAPYGAWSPGVLTCCADDELTPLDWSVDPRDWARPGVSEIVRTIMQTTRTGSIILEHDGGGNRAQTVAALKTAIPRLLGEGYRFAVP